MGKTVAQRIEERFTIDGRKVAALPEFAEGFMGYRRKRAITERFLYYVCIGACDAMEVEGEDYVFTFEDGSKIAQGRLDKSRWRLVA